MSGTLIRLLGVLLMLTAFAVPLVRAPDRDVRTLVARWAPPPSDFVDVKGQIVHLRDEGPRDDPAPLVLLHGTASSLHTFEGWARALSTRRRVITLDLPGFGLTGPFSGQYAPDDYGGDALARFVIDLLDALKVQRFVVGGNSLGGEVAWRVAGLAPARVDRLILVDAGGIGLASESVPLAFMLARVPLVNRLLEHLLPRALVAQGLVAAYGHPERVTSELVDRHFELALREGNRRALGLRLAQRGQGGHAQRIAAIRAPTLILWGGRDRLTPPAAAQEFKRLIGGSELVVFDDLGHLPHEEDAPRTAAEVRRFLGL